MGVLCSGSLCADYPPVAVPRKGTGNNVTQFHPGYVVGRQIRSNRGIANDRLDKRFCQSTTCLM